MKLRVRVHDCAGFGCLDVVPLAMQIAYWIWDDIEQMLNWVEWILADLILPWCATMQFEWTELK